MIISCIYKIVNNINGKIYIGQTRGNAKRRFKRHLSNARQQKLTFALYKSIRKHGSENFSFIVLCLVGEKSKDIMEKYFIKKYKSNDSKFGYNMTSGGEFKVDFTPEMRERIRLKNTGRKLTKEHREKISKAISGSKHPLWGKKHSEQSKLKNRLTHLAKARNKIAKI